MPIKRPGPILLGVGQKYSQLVEGLRLLQVLASRPLDVHDATRSYGLHVRTFYRYLKAFKLAGIPIQSRRCGSGPAKEYYIYKKDWARLIEK